MTSLRSAAGPYGYAGTRRELAISRTRAPLAWAVARRAIEEATGKPVPLTKGVRRGGVRLTWEAAHRRKLALYVAVVGLGVCARHIAEASGLARRWVDEAVQRVEEDCGRIEVEDFVAALTERAGVLLKEERARRGT